MSAELWAIIGVGVGLFGTMMATSISLFGLLRSEISDLRSEMHSEFRAVRSEITELRDEVAGLRDRVATLEGSFEEMRRVNQQILGALINRPAA